jgi:hypothetical protein
MHPIVEAHAADHLRPAAAEMPSQIVSAVGTF